MQSKSDSIVRIFPNFEEKIDFLFQISETFRDLCADYILCVGTVKELKADRIKNAEQIKEYKDLQQSLEQEILAYITKD